MWFVAWQVCQALGIPSNAKHRVGGGIILGCAVLFFIIRQCLDIQYKMALHLFCIPGWSCNVLSVSSVSSVPCHAVCSLNETFYVNSLWPGVGQIFRKWWLAFECPKPQGKLGQYEPLSFSFSRGPLPQVFQGRLEFGFIIAISFWVSLGISLSFLGCSAFQI